MKGIERRAVKSKEDPRQPDLAYLKCVFVCLFISPHATNRGWREIGMKTYRCLTLMQTSRIFSWA